MEHEKPIPKAIIPQRSITILPESLNEPEGFLKKVFDRSKKTPQLIIITGLSGDGKTSWCSRLADLAKERGLDVSGILSPGVFEGQEKTGIEIQDLRTEERRPLARLRVKETSELATPRWVFNQEVMEWADRILRDEEVSDLLIIDELGPLEFLRDEGLLSGLVSIDQQRYRVACVVVRSALLPNAIQRWPNALVVSGAVGKPTSGS